MVRLSSMSGAALALYMCRKRVCHDVSPPPSSASWWDPPVRASRPTLSRRSRSWKAALRSRCTWREFDLATLGRAERCGKTFHAIGTSRDTPD